MKVIACLAFIAAASALQVRVNPLDDVNVPAKEKFSYFKSQFNKVYSSVEKELVALESFISNEKIILEHNSGNHTYTLGHNEFSDLTWDAFKAIYLRAPMPVKEKKNVVVMPAATADAVDWVSKGAVTPVKNQGQCGSCWAFSTTGSLEGAYKLAGNPLTSLSEQDLVSCASSSGNQGCNGGLMDDAFTWIKSNKGLCSEASYPYTSGTGTTGSCKKGCTNVAGTTVKSFTDVAQTENALMSAIAKQPVSIAIEADQNAFQLYSSGVLTGTCGTNLDHGVLAVGYGTQSGTDYFKVKNSWGASWGMKGYILLERGTKQTGGQCGILMSASYPSL